MNLSYNKIRELKNDSFLRYTKLKILSLRRNTVYAIDSYTFVPLSDLKTLDLALNVLLAVPQFLPPKLVRLDLEGNPLIDVFKNTTICITNFANAVSLEVLSLRLNKLEKFPQFCSYMPTLSELDLMKNSFEVLSPSNLAPLCGLKKLNIDVHKYADVELLCECMKFEKWARNRGIILSNEVCDKEGKLKFRF